MKVCVVTNMYPTPASPGYGPFVKSQVESIVALGHEAEVLFIDGRESRLNYLAGVGRLRRLMAERDFDLVHAHYGLTGIVARVQRRLPVVLSYCGDDVFGTSNGHGGTTFGSHMTVLGGQLVSLAVERIILKSEKMLGALRFSSARAKSVVIPNGVDFDRFQPMPREEARARLGWQDPGGKVLFASAAPRAPVKRFDLAHEAVERLRGLDAAVELVTLGDVQPEDMPLYMNACDVMILTSDSEGSPNVVKEAMACNLPVVSVDAGDAWQVMGEAAHCYRAERSPADLADKLRRVLSESSRSDGRRHIGHLELGAVARQVVAVYMSAVKGPRFE